MIFPIGRYLGTAGEAHQVRRGETTERLDPAGFAAWGLGHGPVDPVLAAGVSWTRQELVRYAGLAGLAGPDRLVAGLVERGLLVEAPATGPGAEAFARGHRVVPIAVGLGNLADRPAEFSIGWYGRPLLQVDELRYEVWGWSGGYDTLWRVCQARAGAAPARSGPAGVLSHFLAGVHRLVSANALYLDPV